MARPWEIPELHSDMRLEEAARLVILARFEQMASHRDAVLEDTDIEDLHDMRVASRRLRAAWRCFGSVFVRKGTHQFRREAQHITRVLGTVRDLDVMLDDLKQAQKHAPPDLQERLDDLLEYIEKVRHQAFEPLCETLKVWHPYVFFDLFPQARVREKVHHLLFSEQSHEALSELVEAYLSHEDALGDSAASKEHHQMRIAGKRLRYGLEIFSCCFEHSKNLLETLQEVQEDLGDLHDRDVMLVFLEHRQQVCLSAEIPALDWLIGYYRQQRQAAYTHTLTSWQQAMDAGFEEHLRAL